MCTENNNKLLVTHKQRPTQNALDQHKKRVLSSYQRLCFAKASIEKIRCAIHSIQHFLLMITYKDRQSFREIEQKCEKCIGQCAMEIKSDCATIALLFSLVPQSPMCGIRNAQVLGIPFVCYVPPNDGANNGNALKVLSNKGTKLLSPD